MKAVVKYHVPWEDSIDDIDFIDEMVPFIGKIIDVTPRPEDGPDWFDGGDFEWHHSWLDFVDDQEDFHKNFDYE